MKGLAAPGRMGFRQFSFITIGIIGEEVTTAVLEVLNNGEDPNMYNSTHICLIPKIKTLPPPLSIDPSPYVTSS
jgi:hypothetical protein